eukprot:2608414-Pyramimonas_sp.AAC.1
MRTRPPLPGPIEVPDHEINIEKGSKRKQHDRHRHEQLHHTEDEEVMDKGTVMHDHLLQDHYIKKAPYTVDKEARAFHEDQAQDIPILEAKSETQQCVAYALDRRP